MNGGEPRLRGCIGTLEARYIISGFRYYALTSALRDRRFSPIQARELPYLECTVSLLTDYETATNYLDWKVGKHGMILEFTDPDSARRSATYLPEVAAQEGTQITQITQIIQITLYSNVSKTWTQKLESKAFIFSQKLESKAFIFSQKLESKAFIFSQKPESKAFIFFSQKPESKAFIFFIFLQLLKNLITKASTQKTLNVNFYDF